MIQCQSCGQANTGQSKYCRFCGADLMQPEQQADYDITPPRPYVWKTDEFQINKSEQRKTGKFHFNEPTGNITPAENQPFKTQQLLYQKPYGVIQNHGCPRCNSQIAPRFDRKISNAGWIVFAVLLITFFPLFWIGFLIKEDVRICPVCGYNYD